MLHILICILLYLFIGYLVLLFDYHVYSDGFYRKDYLNLEWFFIILTWPIKLIEMITVSILIGILNLSKIISMTTFYSYLYNFMYFMVTFKRRTFKRIKEV